MEPRIVVVGSVNTDLVVAGERLPGPGETVTGGQFFSAGGGKGANQAVAAARMGARVQLVARVGDDPFGRQALEELAAEGIDTSLVTRDPAVATGVALILTDARGENMISVAPGANRALTTTDIQRAADAIGRAQVVLLQLEIPMECVLLAARIAHEAGVPVVLDPAPAPAVPLSRELLSQVALVKPNEHEAARLTGLAVTDRASAHRATARLVDQGAARAIVTLGAQGAVWRDASGHGECDAPPVQVVDTTAAGDAFTGALASAFALDRDLAKAVQLGCRAGSLAATRRGARPSLPRASEL